MCVSLSAAGAAWAKYRLRTLVREGDTVEVFEAVRTVLAVRRYKKKPVPAEVVRRIVEAGRLSASSINEQPWHFIVVEDRTTLRAIGGTMRSGGYTADAAFAIVVVVEKASVFAVSDGSRAIQNMILMAWSDGVGSNWTGFGPMPAIEKLLGVPKTFEGLAVLPFGYPAAKLGRGRKKRKPLAEVASHERFGTPFA
jgi:nitroreductase